MIFIKDKATRKKLTSAFLQGAVFVGTLGLSAAILWWFLPLWTTLALVGVILMHELAHYFAAIAHGTPANLPFFFAIGGFNLGLIGGGTRIKTKDPYKRLQSVLAGPVVGGLVALAIMAGALIMGFTPAFWVGLLALFQQTLTATVGGDGRRYRRYKRAIAEDQARSGGLFAGV